LEEIVSTTLNPRNEIIAIADRKVGAGQPCFIIAEAGVNHNGSLKLAFELVDIAVRASVDAVKFQTFNAEKICSPSAPKANYQLQSTDNQESQLDMVKRLELPFEAFRELQSYCNAKGILFLSTPFDYDSIDFLAELRVPAFKIASGEITNLPFVEHVARKGRPLILSTGMATLSEVGKAVETIRTTGNQQLVLLQCVSNYPAQPSSVNLRAMQTMVEAFGVPAGYSDHTTGTEIAIAAIALGACVVEKHFTISRELPGPDHGASLEPDELASMVRSIRNVEAALGDGRKQPALEEANNAAVARRSLVAARHIGAGTVLTEDLVAIMRPGTGLPPAMRSELVGRRTRRDIEAGTVLTLDMVA
jgi:N,N'-diacetyllegionaminate synthase